MSSKSVFITSYDWSDYGHGVDGLFGTFKEAVDFSEADPGWQTGTQLEEIDSDHWVISDQVGDVRYITRLLIDPDVLFGRKDPGDAT